METDPVSEILYCPEYKMMDQASDLVILNSNSTYFQFPHKEHQPFSE
jgi:hypothetical protein